MLDSLESENELKSIIIKYDGGKTEKFLLMLFLVWVGMKLGPIAGRIDMDKKTIEVNPENFETNKKIFVLVIFVVIREN